jgi:hypothetical protein
VSSDQVIEHLGARVIGREVTSFHDRRRHALPGRAESGETAAQDRGTGASAMLDVPAPSALAEHAVVSGPSPPSRCPRPSRTRSTGMMAAHDGIARRLATAADHAA